MSKVKADDFTSEIAGKKPAGARKVIAYIVLVLVSVLCVFWLYLMFINMTRTHSDIQHGMSFLPGRALVRNFKLALRDSTVNVFVGLRNSFIVAIAATVLGVYFSTLTAYAIHAYDFKLKKFIFTFILVIMMIPSQVTVLGFVRLVLKMKLTNNFIPLIIPSIAAPVTFFYLKQYMESALPMSLIEAARIDGSGELKTFNHIVLPLMKPAIAVQAIFSFVGTWNNYFVPSQILTKPEVKTLPILIALLRSKDWASLDMGQVYMVMGLSILPVVIVYLIISKQIVQGVALGSVKG